MKALILEDNRYKLQDAVTALKKRGIVEYTHFSSCNEAIDCVICNNCMKEFDLVILDLNFYMDKQFIDACPDMATSNASAKFLLQMIENELDTPVIIFSSQGWYFEIFKNYPLPNSFSAYARMFQNRPLVKRYSEADLKKDFEEKHRKLRKKLSKLNFIIGHAHDEKELNFFINEFFRMINPED